MRRMKMNDYKALKILIIVASGLFFSLGVMLMDYGATFKDMPIIGQSLIFEAINPRIMYHLGLIDVVGVFFTLVIVSLHEVLKI